MSDRVKYFLLGLLFLVVAGVIAFDRLNNNEPAPSNTEVARENANAGETWINPPLRKTEADAGPSFGERFGKRDSEPNRTGNGTGLIIDPNGNRAGTKLAPDRNPDRNAGRNPDRVVVPPIKRDPVPVNADTKPAPVRTGTAKTHIVRSGETLESISKEHYPGQVYRGIKLISTANKIRNPNHISINQKLIIPAMDARSTGTPTVARNADRSSIPSVHTVRSSDGDLYAICRRYYGSTGEGKRVRQIMKLNDLWSVHVAAGTKLKLPPR